MYAPFDLRFVGIFSLASALYTGERRLPGIFGVQLGKLAQDLFRSLVPELGYYHLHGDNFIAAYALVDCRRNSLATHAQLLPALGSGRDLQLGAAVDGRHVDFGSQRGFRHSHWDLNLNIIARPCEYGMAPDLDGQEKTPCGAPL